VIAESPTGVETAGQKFVVKCEILPEDGLLCEALVTSRGRPALLRYMAQAYLAGLQEGGTDLEIVAAATKRTAGGVQPNALTSAGGKAATSRGGEHTPANRQVSAPVPSITPQPRDGEALLDQMNF